MVIWTAEADRKQPRIFRQSQQLFLNPEFVEKGRWYYRENKLSIM